MIPTKSHTISQTGSLPGKVTYLTVDVENMPHILNILTNMYSDIIKAILREYSANALDSHIKAGQTRPIEIRTPNRFHPYLEIQDWGTGMSVDFVETKFSKYGTSTKRTTNKEVGTFGIGGKSALAYADSFIMTTVQNGIKGIFVVSRDDNGAAIITTIDTAVTDEPNGTLFSIPAKQNEDFDDKVDWFFKFWEPGTVLVNGEQPRHFEAEKLTDDIFYSTKGGQSYVVMGNIPYRVVNAGQFIPNSAFKNFAFIAKVPVGSVSTVPSREDLEYGDQKTMQTLRDIGTTFADKMLDKVKNDILSQPDHYSAHARWRQWRAEIGETPLKDLEYKGDKFAESMDVSGFVWVPGGYRRRTLTRLRWGVNIRDLGFVIVHDKTKKIPWVDVSSYQRQRVRLYAQEKGLRLERVHFLDEVPRSPWIQGLKVITWDDIKTVKPASTATRRAAAGTVEVLNDSGAAVQTPISNLPDKNLVLATPSELRGLRTYNLMAALKNLKIDATIIKLPANRWNKFKREHQDVDTLRNFIKTQVALHAAAIPAETWKLKSLESRSKFVLKSLDPAQVDDPEIKALIPLVKQNVVKYQAEFDKVNNLAVQLNGVLFDYQDKISEDWVEKRYPLIKALESYYYKSDYGDEVVIYMNAAYAARKDQP